jgi:hypothetical protein
MKFIPHCRGQTKKGKITMKLQNLIHILIGIVCIGLLPGAQAILPAPDGGYPGGNTAEWFDQKAEHEKDLECESRIADEKEHTESL